MTMPHLQNCPHTAFWWCLACVKELWEEKEALRKRLDIVREAATSERCYSKIQALTEEPPPRPAPLDDWKGCTPNNHLGPFQQYTEYCMNCGRNEYTNEK